jgi:hypothetical protein
LEISRWECALKRNVPRTSCYLEVGFSLARVTRADIEEDIGDDRSFLAATSKNFQNLKNGKGRRRVFIFGDINKTRGRPPPESEETCVFFLYMFLRIIEKDAIIIIVRILLLEVVSERIRPR